MPTGLKRYQDRDDLHFITFSCYRRQPYLAAPGAYPFFAEYLERTRVRHSFEIIGYVLMPEHVHLLLTEPPQTPLARVIKALKQETSRRLKQDRKHFWTERYYDFNVFTRSKMIEKLKYMHRNPVKRALAETPEDWPWSSFNFYASNDIGTVTISPQ